MGCCSEVKNVKSVDSLSRSTDSSIASIGCLIVTADGAESGWKRCCRGVAFTDLCPM